MESVLAHLNFGFRVRFLVLLVLSIRDFRKMARTESY